MTRKKTQKNKKAAGEVVSANETTGSLQHITPTEEEIEKFNKQFNKR